MKFILFSAVSALSCTSFAESYAGLFYIYNRLLAQQYQENKAEQLINTRDIEDRSEVTLILDVSADPDCTVRITSSKNFERISSLTQGHFIKLQRDSENRIELFDGQETIVIPMIQNREYPYKYESHFNKEAGTYTESEVLGGLEQNLKIEISGRFVSRLGFKKIIPEKMKISAGGKSIVCQTSRSIYIQ